FLAAGFLAAGFLAAGFLAAGFLAAGFLAAFLAAGFLAAGFLAAFLAAGFLAALLAAGFLAAGFLAAADFFGEAFLGEVFFTGEATATASDMFLSLFLFSCVEFFSCTISRLFHTKKRQGEQYPDGTRRKRLRQSGSVSERARVIVPTKQRVRK
ncbi:uncharacterized protein Tco025E_08654, partial [Trypanosoma conorhini]